jgi:hypothetical protein
VVGQLLEATPHNVADARRNVDLQISERFRILQESFGDQEPNRLAHKEGIAFRLAPDPLHEIFRRTDAGRQFDVAADVLPRQPFQADLMAQVLPADFGKGSGEGMTAAQRHVSIRADDQEMCVPHRRVYFLGQELKQAERWFIRPLQVVEDQ